MARRQAPDVRRSRWTGWTARLGVGAVVLSTVALASPYGPFGGDGDEPVATAKSAPGKPSAAKGVPARLHTQAVTATADGRRARLTRATTDAFSMVGLTWKDSAASVDGQVEIRTRHAGGPWTSWRTLEVDSGDLPDGNEGRAGRGGTDPLWVGPSDGIQVRVDGRSALPAGMRLDLIDPTPAKRGGAEPIAFVRPASVARGTDTVPVPGGEGGADTDQGTPTPAPESTDTPTPGSSPDATATEAPASPTPTVSASGDPTAAPTEAPTATAAPTPAPPTVSPAPTVSSAPTVSPAPISSVTAPEIVSRVGWRADESIRPGGEPEYGTAARVVFVHHSDTAVEYECADSARILRSMYTYHVQSKGWSDLAYNFAVDKCGTVFEGRAGGVDRPVIGAHTYGFNTDSAGVVVIGTYTTVNASSAALAAVAHVADWKLGFSGGRPDGSGTLVQAASNSKGFVKGRSYAFKAISGHRDGRATECPGEHLYAQLPGLRSQATRPTAVTLKDITGARLSGDSYYGTGNVTVSWKATTAARLVTRYEVLVDKAVVARTTSLNASITLAPGSHSLAVRTVHLRGTSATSTPVTVVADSTAPIFSPGPGLALRTGTVTAGAAPVALTWGASDNAGLAEVRATAPKEFTFTPTTTRWNTSIAPAAKRTFILRATDLAGNTRDASKVVTATLVKESAATRTGTWSTKKNSNYLDGSAATSSAAKASQSWVFTGTSVGWVAARGTTSGRADVYVDGARVATVDTKSDKTRYRQIVWSVKGLKAGKHTVKIVVAGTSGRRGITSDGIVVLS